jgi:autotransporter-associated beta strand protein
MVDEDTERTYTFDGTGRTIVSGGLHDKYILASGPSEDGTGHYRKTGTGSLLVSNTNSTYHGNTIVEAGTIRFTSAAHLANTSAIVSTGGAIGVDFGIFSNATLLAKFDEADTGGIMVQPSEAAMNLDFTSGPLVSARNTSVAAPESGITYTGTITPGGSEYRLGGGSGTLTLPNQNQLTGDHGLVVTNGGEVRLAASHNYTGPTVVSDYAFTSRTNQAIADTTTGISQQMYAPTTLTVGSLKSGGIDSSVGRSSNDASNLVIQGSTLRIDGATDKIQRLFTVGSRGATIETVGETRAFFVNSGAIEMTPAGTATTRTLTLACESIVNGMDSLISDATDGGVVGLTKTGVGKWELFGNNTYSGPTRIREGQLNVNRVQTGTGDTIVEADGTLGGVGAVGGNVIADGAIAPGRSVGTLQVAGNLALSASSELVIEIANVTPGSYDRLEVGGNAQLAGTLRVELLGSPGNVYAPKLGDVFGFLSVSGGAGGMFDTLDLPSLAPGLTWSINPGNVTVFLHVVAALPGDYSMNGVVDAADFTVWRDTLGQTGNGLAADGNNDQRIDDADLAVWRSQFGQSLPGAGQAATNVPEPAALSIALLAAVGIVQLRAWRRW